MPSEAEIAENKLDLVNIDQKDISSVTELSGNIKQVLSATPQFNDILLKGEISNFVQATSGHIYFSLKDQNCAIACAFFRHLQAAGCSDLGDGIQAVVMGSVVVYEPKSQYQLNIKKIIPIGDDLHLSTFQPSSTFQLSYLNENFILARYEAIFPLSSSLTSNSVTSPILRFQMDSDAVSIAFLAASSQLVGDDPTSSITL
jgi:hypothetical protein